MSTLAHVYIHEMIDTAYTVQLIDILWCIFVSGSVIFIDCNFNW